MWRQLVLENPAFFLLYHDQLASKVSLFIFRDDFSFDKCALSLTARDLSPHVVRV